jgi:hypothetical protein
MSDKQRPALPVVLMLEGTEQAVSQLKNPLLERLYGEERPLVVNLERQYFSFWWSDPLREENLAQLLLAKRDISANQAAEWVETEDFVTFVRWLISQQLNRAIMQHWPDEEFNEHWLNAVQLVVVGEAALSRSPYVKRVFDGFFPKSLVIDSRNKELLAPVGVRRNWDDVPIDELDLNIRAYHCIRRAGIYTVGELLAKSEQDLHGIPNVGQVTIDGVVEVLARHNLKLWEE